MDLNLVEVVDMKGLVTVKFYNSIWTCTRFWPVDVHE
jgi:hypothetical protein